VALLGEPDASRRPATRCSRRWAACSTVA